MADAQAEADTDEIDELAWRELLAPVLQRWRRGAAVFIACGVAGYAASFLVTPQYTSTTTFIPPQQQQSTAAAALSSLGALAGLAGGAAGVKSPADEYVSLMQSVTVLDRMVDRFGLMKLYDKRYRVDARKKLVERSQVLIGKKDGLITVAVDDESPQRAADMANQFVQELRAMTSTLAVSEAQQRRVFFEAQMQQTQRRLVDAQAALQQSGVGAGAIKAEPRAAADEYAHLRAEAAAAEVRLRTLGSSLASTAPQVVTQEAQLKALREQLSKLEAVTPSPESSTDYVSRYREFKYQGTLFDLLARQYEAARVDEAREGALVQVVDVAQPAERRSSPRRLYYAIGAALLGAFVFGAWVVTRHRQPGPSRQVGSTTRLA